MMLEHLGEMSMKVKEFTGGLNSKIDPSLLPANAAVELVNADISSGSLKSQLNEGSPTFNNVSQYFAKFNGSIVSQSTKTKYVEYVQDLYYANGVGQLKQLRSGILYDVGIARAEDKLDLLEVDRPDAPIAVNSITAFKGIQTFRTSFVLATPTGNLIGNTTYSYKLVYKDSGGNVVGVQDFDHEFISSTDETLSVHLRITNDLYTVELYREYSGAYHYTQDLIAFTGYGYTHVIHDTILDISLNTPFVGSDDASIIQTPSTTLYYDVYTVSAKPYIDVDGNPATIDLLSLPYTVSATTPIEETAAGDNSVNDFFVEIETADPTNEIVVRRYIDPDTGVGTDWLLPYDPVNNVFVDAFNEPTTSRLYSTIDLPALIDGTYTYVYTYYNSVTGVESQPNPVSSEQVVFDGLIYISGMVPSPDITVDKINLYRVGGLLSEYSLVLELDIDAVDHYDILSDADIEGSLLVTETYTLPQIGLTLLTEVNGVLLGALGSKLYFSIQGVVYAWPITNFIEFGTTITCIEECANGIIVTTRVKTYVITGNSPRNYSKYLISGEHGCEFDASYRRLGSGVIFKSTTGLCYTVGADVKVVSKDFFHPLDISVIGSCVHNNVYYALSSTDIFIFNLTDGNFYTTDIVASNIDVIDDAVQVLVGTSLYKLGSDLNSKRTLTYKSPMFTEGEHSNHKIYKNFYFAIDGTFTVSIYLDNVVVLTKTISGRDIFDIKVPQDRQRAMDCQIKLVGTGVVYGYDYLATGRQNGR